MPESILIGKEIPFCPGCGHTVTVNGIAKALENMRVAPLDVILVSDIGCCGLIDNLVKCHTVHGLHGRAAALATGVAMGLDDPDKIVIAVQGDGGATIGLQHLLEASRLNVNMNLIVHNNMVYGMTGGQISGLSPEEFKAIRLPEQQEVPPYDICELAYRAGASYSCRTFVGMDVDAKLEEAFRTNGFSIVEVVETCPVYGVKKAKELQELMQHGEVTLKNDRSPARTPKKDVPSITDSLHVVESKYDSPLKTRLEIVIAGSAGEGVQSAGELLASAGLSAGLHTSRKGEYPVTVGTGFSIAEVILSREKILYTGIESPDVMIITSKDGLAKGKERIGEKTRLVMDSQLEVPSGKEAMIADFRSGSGRRGITLSAIAYWLKQSGIIPLDALIDAAKTSKHADALIATIQKATALQSK